MPYILSRGEARELLAVIPGFPWLVASSRLTDWCHQLSSGTATKNLEKSSNLSSRSLEKYYLEAVNLGIARSRESCEYFGTDCCPLKTFLL